MLALAFTFPSGRYHATPWDRHVNEGAVVWPPEPWRVLRALIATWHHKIKPLDRHEESTLRGLIEALSQSLPEYELPPASHSHTRHYMPQREPGKTSLVFDAFAAISRKEPLVMAWPELDLPQEQLALLDDLLAVMGFVPEASCSQVIYPLASRGKRSYRCSPRWRRMPMAASARVFWPTKKQRRSSLEHCRRVSWMPYR